MMLLLRADFAKSYIAAHTRTLPGGKVVQVAAFSDKRYKRVERDHDTMDMFKPDLPAPKKPIPDECARHPESCTPDLFTGETRTNPEEKKAAGTNARADAQDKFAAVYNQHKDKRGAASKKAIDDAQAEYEAFEAEQAAAHAEVPDDIMAPFTDMVVDLAEQAEKKNSRTANQYAKDARSFIDQARADGKINGAQHYKMSTHIDGALGRLTKSQPRILFFKSHIDTFTRKDGSVVQAHDDKRTKRMPLEGHPYHDKSDDELHYIVKDAGEAAQANKGGRSEGKYLDQMNDASTVLYHRKQNGIVKPMESRLPKTMTKSRILFFKSHVKQYTDKNGRMVKEHDDKRTKKLAPVGAGRAAAAPEQQAAPKPVSQAEPGSAHGYGPHNVEAGDSLKFKAGDFAGAGKVKSVGQDGVTVTDASGRDHGVHWHEVAGRGGKADGGGNEPPVDDAKPVADTPEPPEKKEPAEAKEPAGDKPTNVVDIKSKKAKAEDIARALFDTSELAKLPGKVDQPKELDSWEKISEKAPEALEQFKGKLKQVSDALGLEQDRIPSSFDMAQEEENAKAKKEDRQPKTLSKEKYMSPALWNNPRGFLFIGPLKKHDRALAKVKADYTDKETGDQDWKKLKDVVRATIAVPSVTQIPKVLAEMEKAGIKLAQKPKNNLTGDGLFGSGYRDLNLIVQMPNGMMCELQIHCKPITEAKEHGHEHYAENAAIERQYPGGRDDMDKWSEEHKAKYKENHGKMKAMYDAAWEKSLSSNDSGEKDLRKALAGRTIILWKRGTK